MYFTKVLLTLTLSKRQPLLTQVSEPKAAVIHALSLSVVKIAIKSCPPKTQVIKPKAAVVQGLPKTCKNCKLAKAALVHSKVLLTLKTLVVKHSLRKPKLANRKRQ